MHTLYREFTEQAQIDAQYNASLQCANVAAEMRHYVEASQRAREHLPCKLNLPYGPTLAETLDIFPAVQAHAPVFVFLHGGYWRALSSQDFSCIALGLHKLGITTVVVNYALCPRVSIDEIVRQARAAVAWVLRHIAAHRGDPGRVAVGGHSAGAHLAAMCLKTAWAQDYGLPEDPLKAALLVSGLYDLAPLRYSYLQPMIQLDDGVIRRNSPAFMVRPCTTPIWTTWGALETPEFARQSRTYHAVWEARGNAGVQSALPDAHHYSAIHGFERADSVLCRWLALQLGLTA